MTDAAPELDLPQLPPKLQQMVDETKAQVRTMYGLSLKYEKEGDASKAKRYERKKRQLEAVLHVLEALRHWMGQDLDDKQIWHVLAHCLKSPAPSIEIVAALKNYVPPATPQPQISPEAHP